jgi:CubicO group peptidase (beta-lactamase class C family)
MQQSARFAYLSAALLATLVPAARAAEPFDPKPVDALVKQALKAWNVPGAAVAIVRNGEVSYLKGHGLREVVGKDPVTPDTLFPIASCTKAFTTTAMAILVDEGKLRWDDPVRKHVPFFRLSDPLANREVTLRDLVCHRTGLAGHDLLWYRSPWSQEEVIRRAGLLPLDRPFRSAFQYQSTMFTAAGLAVASAAKTPWADFVQKRLFDPLEMKTAVFTSTAAEKAADHATGHRVNQLGRVEVMQRYPNRTPDPAGSVQASARDLARWVRFHLGDGTAGGKRLVSAAGLAQTHAPQMVVRLEGADRELHPDTSQMSYGMGWVIHDYRGQKLVAHAGAIDGFRVHFTLVPRSRLGIVILANMHQTRMNLALTNGLVDLLLGLPRKDWNGLLGGVVRRAQARAAEAGKARLAGRRHGTRPSLELAAYVGKYEHPAYGTVQVTLERGQLVWAWNAFRGPLEHFHFDTFTVSLDPIGTVQVLFTLGPGGSLETMRTTGALNVEFRKANGRR